MPRFGTLFLVERLRVDEASELEQFQELRVGAATLIRAIVLKGQELAIVDNLHPEAVF